MTQAQPFTATTPFPGPGIDTLAVYCSDGRFVRQCEQFVEQQLQAERSDRLVVPGGPAALLESEAHPGAMAWARFLIEAHGIERIILITHADCGDYAHRRQLTGDDQRQAQQQDLATVTVKLRELCDGLSIACFEARLDNDGQQVIFLPAGV